VWPQPVLEGRPAATREVKRGTETALSKQTSDARGRSHDKAMVERMARRNVSRKEQPGERKAAGRAIEPCGGGVLRYTNAILGTDSLLDSMPFDVPQDLYHDDYVDYQLIAKPQPARQTRSGCWWNRSIR
jgi:hypothetical protein